MVPGTGVMIEGEEAAAGPVGKARRCSGSVSMGGGG